MTNITISKIMRSAQVITAALGEGFISVSLKIKKNIE